MWRSKIVLIIGLSLIAGSIGGLLLITYRQSDRQIGAYVDFIAQSGCSITGARVGPLLGPGSGSRITTDALIWVSSDCEDYRLESSRRIDVESVNGAYEISETIKSDNPFDTWKYVVHAKDIARPFKTLIVAMKDIGRPISFSSWRFDLGVRPAGVKVTAYGSDDALLRNVILNEGDNSKAIIATYVDRARERIQQVLVIVFSALIGVGASAVFQSILFQTRS